MIYSSSPMQLTLEPTEKYSIQAYEEHQLKVDSIIYATSIIVTPNSVIPDWGVEDLTTLEEVHLEKLLLSKPKIVLIGYPSDQKSIIPYRFIPLLAVKQIGLEFMPIGAACRTFNILLNEQREVVLGFIPRHP